MIEDYNCAHCGMMHQGQCPRIKAIEYYENGTVKRVEYLTPADSMPPLGGYPAWPAPLANPPFQPLVPTWGGEPGLR